MNKARLAALLAAAILPLAAGAQEKVAFDKPQPDKPSVPSYKIYGFIRNYFAFDTRESEAGTLDLLYFLPKDENNNLLGDDLNQQNSFRYLSLTSRVGLDVTGYKYRNMTASAKIETDFYCMNGNTATLRLRQAYMNLAWKLEDGTQLGLKMGQAWHPMAADMPDVLALAVGAPFGPFNRSPQANFEAKLSKNLSFNVAGIWQMQYLSMGPSGASANYMKYSGIPEIYAGVNFTSGGFLMRAGLDVLSIKPRYRGTYREQTVRVSDRITTMSPFAYAQYKKGAFTFKAKTTFAQGGEHLNLMSGYALSQIVDPTNWVYTPYRSSSTWVNFTYGSKLQGVLLLGYMRNLGTANTLYAYDAEAIAEASASGDEEKILAATHANYASSVIYFNKSAWNLNQMFRVAPNVLYNLGKVTFGLEYELTGVQYGDKTLINRRNGLADQNLHWVANNRVTFMAKYSF